jgi:hypothetical protein
MVGDVGNPSVPDGCNFHLLLKREVTTAVTWLANRLAVL